MSGCWGHSYGVGARGEDVGMGITKRAMWRILMVAEIFYTLTASLSVHWLGYCVIVLQDIII